MNFERKKEFLLLAVCFFSMYFIGCSVKTSVAGRAADFTGGMIEKDRMLIWSASLDIEVDKVSDAVDLVVSIIEESGGYVESKSMSGEKGASFKLRVPSKQLTPVIDRLADLGHETHRRISAQDVTELYIDTEARLKNAIALRDRLKKLLKRAVNVKDVLIIEKELTRLQSDIDSMEGKLKNLKGRVDYSSIALSLDQKTILGPLGYVFKGVGWVIEKLFVIR